MKDAVAYALGRQERDHGRSGHRTLVRRERTTDAVEDPFAHHRDREAVRRRRRTGPERGLVGPVRVCMTGVVAGTRPVRIHRTIALRVRALMVRGRGVKAVHEGLHRRALQAYRHDDEEGQEPKDSRPPKCGGRDAHSGILGVMNRCIVTPSGRPQDRGTTTKFHKSGPAHALTREEAGATPPETGPLRTCPRPACCRC